MELVFVLPRQNHLHLHPPLHLQTTQVRLLFVRVVIIYHLKLLQLLILSINKTNLLKRVKFTFSLSTRRRGERCQSSKSKRLCLHIDDDDLRASSTQFSTRLLSVFYTISYSEPNKTTTKGKATTLSISSWTKM